MQGNYLNLQGAAALPVNEPVDEAFIRTVAKQVVERRAQRPSPHGLTTKSRAKYAALLEDAYRPAPEHAEEVASWQKKAHQQTAHQPTTRPSFAQAILNFFI